MPQFVCFLNATRPEMPHSPTDEESRIVGEHFEYLKTQLADGKLILAGRTFTDPVVGLVIFEADDEAAALAFAHADPAVGSGVFTARVQPYGVALLRQAM